MAMLMSAMALELCMISADGMTAATVQFTSLQAAR